MVSESLPPLVTPDKYTKERAAYFPSLSAFEHFKRQNKTELVTAGALVLHRGAWLVNPRIFDEQILVIATSRASAQLERQCAKAEASR